MLARQGEFGSLSKTHETSLVAVAMLPRDLACYKFQMGSAGWPRVSFQRHLDEALAHKSIQILQIEFLFDTRYCSLVKAVKCPIGTEDCTG